MAAVSLRIQGRSHLMSAEFYKPYARDQTGGKWST